jgi:hypothetical protein
MPTKTSAGPNEVVRLDVLRLRLTLTPHTALALAIWTSHMPPAVPRARAAANSLLAWRKSKATKPAEGQE